MKLFSFSWKKATVGVVLLTVVFAAHAILPLFLATFIIENMTVVDISMALSGVLSGVLWYDCNGFTSLTDCRNADKAKINADSVDNIFGKKPIQIDLKPDGVRGNPDPKKWDASGRDVVPKSSFEIYAGITAMPSSFVAVVQDIGGVGSKTYYSTSGNTTYSRTETVSAVRDNARSASWSGSVTIAGTSSTFYVYDQATIMSCDAGYTLSNGVCNLTDTSAVKKPSTTPCEVLYNSDSKTFDFDSKNPNCSGLDSQMLVNQGKRISTVGIGSGEQLMIDPQDNGSMTVTQFAPDGSFNVVSTSAYDAGKGGYPITGVMSSNGSGSSGTNDGNTSGTGGSGTTGTGTGDSAGGQCGIAGKPACSVKVDETGTPTDAGDKLSTGGLNQQMDKVDQVIQGIGSTADKDTSWGIFPSWFNSGDCTPWDLYTFNDIPVRIDYCSAVPLAKGVGNFVWIVFTFFAVVNMVGKTVGAGSGK